MRKEELYQVSTLATFQNRGYDGQLSIRRMLEFGNTGFGTFHGLNGEMIVVGGVVYRALGDCTLEAVKDSETTPFATLGFLGKKAPVVLDVYGNLTALKESLDDVIGDQQKLILSQISGVFEKIAIHSVWPQTKPYDELKKIVDDQDIYIYENIEGTLVGVHCPQSAEGFNVLGWHFHFISEDRQIGGHVNGLFAHKIEFIYDEKEVLTIIEA
ncbi:acetolactate decarboxylase [Acetobacterium bakii]|uniref:Alpha-acetolactate decarboxylase n=1 Tax=Acetobacterium bakii TaxID=52689 RepID=A0A0L6U437_9FIRM|nr:acetolactate decarboxylase [Acetobacterium bakii]KNZ43281.1 hypothetical protein AKG39_02245 [Acetobacterium bakii]